MFRSTATGRFALAALLAFGLHPFARAEEPALTLREALNRTLQSSPELAPFAYQLKAQNARIESAGLKPAPEFVSELENVLGTGRTRGLDAAEATVGLSQVIELGGQRARRQDAARQGLEGVEVKRQLAQLDVLAEVSRQFIHVASDQEQLKLTELATTLAERTVVEVRRRVQAAKSPQVELNRANILLTRAEVDREHAEHELLTSRRKLSALWGASEPDFELVEAHLFQLPAVVEYERLAAQLAVSPDLQRFATEARQRDADILLAESKARSHLTVSASVRRLQEEGDTALVAGFSMPLFGSRTAKPAIAEARALRESVGSEAAAAQLKAETRLFELVQELKHSVTEAETLRDAVLPQMEEALRQTEYAYERGRYSYLEWVDAQRERVAVQRSLIEAAENAQLFQIEIDRLTATAVSR